MTDIHPGPTASALVCARCGARLTETPRDGLVTCPSCGLSMPVAALSELDSLTSWADWAHARAGWLRARLVAGDLPAEGWSASGVAMPALTPGLVEMPPAPGTGAAAAVRPRPSAGTLLLVGGAVLLVLAGIAFIGFAWELLGPLGQLTTLYLMGALALLAGLRLHARLPGTATTLAVVGVLLVAVSSVATRVLGADPMGASTALAASVAAAAALAAVGVWIRGRLKGAGEVGALVGAALVLGLLALAPVDDAVPLGGAWAWWPAVVLLVSGVALLLLAHRFAVLTWPALAALSLFVGSVVLGVFVATEASVDDPVRPFLAGVVLLATAAFSVLLVRVLPGHRREPALTAAGLVVGAAGVAFVSGEADAVSRPWSALVLLGVAGFAWWARAHLPVSLRPVTSTVAAAALGASVGFAVAPWSTDWAAWRGLLAGLVLSAVVVVLAELDRRSENTRGIPALVAAAAGLVVWLVAASPGEGQTTSDDVRWAMVVALSLLAVTGWVEALRRRLPAWSVWSSGGLLIVALVPLSQLADLSTTWSPEVHGLALGTVAAAAGVLFWWLRRPAGTPSLVVLGPALALALAPTTIAIVQDATNRWGYGDPVGTAYQVRVVVLFVVGAGLVAVGVWRRLAGLVVPATMALLVVTGVQLVDLGRFLPQWVSFAVAGGLLVLAGARWEKVRTLGQESSDWVRQLH
jgi:hypothetical protein